VTQSSVSDVARAIAHALADDRVRRHQFDLSPATDDEEKVLARQTGEAFFQTNDETWGMATPIDLSERLIIDEAISRVLGLGKLEPLLDDDDVSDIHVRGNRPVWVKLRNGERRMCSPIVDSDEELIGLIRRIATRMGHREQRFDPSHPELNLQLRDGSRVFAAMDVSMHPTLIIRRHRFEFSHLSELVHTRMMTSEVAQFLSAAVRAKFNIVIAGGTGSGKTTLLRSLINEIPQLERIVTIEDAFEIGLERFEKEHPDHDSLQVRSANSEGLGEITMSDLTRMALRMDPDRVVVGEVRGAEAFPMLLAMSQGNNGSMCTMHADSPRSVFPKLLAYVSMARTGIPTESINLLTASSIHFVVHVQVQNSVRVVTSIHEVVQSNGFEISTNEIYSRIESANNFVSLRRHTQIILEEYGFQFQRESSWAS
jgi:Flp pilus assembly CpaF family ATPase